MGNGSQGGSLSTSAQVNSLLSISMHFILAHKAYYPELPLGSFRSFAFLRIQCSGSVDDFWIRTLYSVFVDLVPSQARTQRHQGS